MCLLTCRATSHLTPSQGAIRYDEWGVVEFLLALGCSVDTVDIYGRYVVVYPRHSIYRM